MADLTESQRHAARPLAWEQEWIETNGDIHCLKNRDGRYVVILSAGDLSGEMRPISTGIGATLNEAWNLAIQGLDGLQAYLTPG